jgi:hypothetical protein
MVLKIEVSKGTTRKFCLNTSAVHIDSIRHPPICLLLDTLFSCQCPFKKFENYHLFSVRVSITPFRETINF